MNLDSRLSMSNYFTYRITKYSPKKRDENDNYLGIDWTCYHDVGKRINDSVLTYEEYEKIENAYINAI
jgi:hypothetical protein